MKISKLSIYSNKIKAQLKFYRDDLGFEILNYDEKSFEIKCGYSVLRFEYRENPTPYHIAFHIPDNQEKYALQWIENKTNALKNNNDKIIDFSNWQAKSVYFYDEDENIMEFISRNDFSKPKSALFSADSIVGIAEIGLATEDIPSNFEKMKQECKLEKFDGNFEHFCAVGEPSGLIITINKNKKDWFPTSDKAYSSAFELEFSHQSKNYLLKFSSNDRLNISQL
ncbi:glyoxalase [Christiangramia fulva]|uniref:Glyoxalase n=1 Tax=Christiangramia fulva TaxID=2126553 RepID=A0A2R3Z0U6_9FLAO|nr:glyoxalase [Christiangramia fulva]AVR43883.1 glyoxalase [Christiangramia fulva]